MNLNVSTFRTDCTDKEQAKKVLEEAAEVYGAYELHDATSKYEFAYAFEYYERSKLADEIADLITAACNLAERYGIDVQSALARVERKNRARGRYQ